MLRENEKLQEQIKRVSEEKAQKEQELAKTKGKYAKAKQVLQDRNGKSAGATPVGPPRGQKGRKTRTDQNGKVKEGFCIRKELGLEGDANLDTYLLLREFIRNSMPFNTHQAYKTVPPKVLGKIQLEAEEKFALLKGKDWAIPVLLKDAYDNKHAYQKKKARKATTKNTNDTSDEVIDEEPLEVSGTPGDTLGPDPNQQLENAATAPTASTDIAESEHVATNGAAQKTRPNSAGRNGNKKGKGRAERSPSLSDLSDEEDEEELGDNNDGDDDEEQEGAPPVRGKKRQGDHLTDAPPTKRPRMNGSSSTQKKMAAGPSQNSSGKGKKAKGGKDITISTRKTRSQK